MSVLKTTKIVLVIAIVGTLIFMGFPGYMKTTAVTPTEIEDAIEAGLAYLASVQNPTTGAWVGAQQITVSQTAFVLIKLQDRAVELGLDPFETDSSQSDYYEYATNVIDGWEFLFSKDGAGNPLYIRTQTIDDQDHTGGASGTIDDPDTRVNGYGIYLSPYTVYGTGIFLMALAASGDPSHVNEGGIDYDGDTNPETFGQIAQDAVDWLAWAQADSGNAEGGFEYGPLDDSGWRADNSNSGYAFLGLAAAEGFGCTVPLWVKTETNEWIDYIQKVGGGSAYATWNSGWINELKTGNLIFEMTFYGDTPATPRFKDAIGFIEANWNGQNLDPGWKGDLGIDDDGDTLIDEDPWDAVDNDLDGKTDEDQGMIHYQAIYCLMKGLEYSGIDYLDLDGGGTPDDDWYQEFAQKIVDTQDPLGFWPSSPCYVWPAGWPNYGRASGPILSTVWALLTLEKVTPPPPFGKNLEPSEGELGDTTHVTINVVVGSGQTVKVCDILPRELSYIVGTFTVNGDPETPTIKKMKGKPPKRAICYEFDTAGSYEIEFDALVDSADAWKSMEVCNVVKGAWFEDDKLVDCREATACYTILPFEQLDKGIVTCDIDWPKYHNDLALKGYSTSEAPDTNDILWTYDTGSVVQSSPAVVNGIVYIGATNGYLYALDADSEGLIWKYPTGGSIYSSPAVEYGMVYVLSTRDDPTNGNMYALDAETGAKIWSVSLGHGSWDWSSPAVNNGYVFIGSSNGYVHKLNAYTGATSWKTYIGASPNSPITVANGKVYSGTHNFNNLNPTLVALNEGDGSVAWKYDYYLHHNGVAGMINHNGVAVADGDGDNDLEVYFGVYNWFGTGPQAVCLDEVTGTEVWTASIGSHSTSTPAVHNGRVFIGSDNNKLYALDASDGSWLWDYTTGGNVWSAPAVADGKVFFGSLDHKVYAVEEDDGDLVWSYYTGASHILGSPAVACGKVFVGNQNGKVYAFGPSYMAKSAEVCVETNVQWIIELKVQNPYSFTMEDIMITDRFGAEIELDEEDPVVITHGSFKTWTEGNSDKVFFEWDIGDLEPGETAKLRLLVSTDLNPSGKQEYTTAGEYELNSGVTMKFDDYLGNQLSATTGSLIVTAEDCI